VRHRIASYSQQSQRYVQFDDANIIVPQSIKEHGAEAAYKGMMQRVMNVYQDMITMGVPPEDARMIVPNGVETKITVTMNARALHNFFRERMCRRAQWEIRDTAFQMYNLCMDMAPALFDTAGPDCVTIGCQQGKMSCGRPYKRDRYERVIQDEG
jgi:thymidylate synthase (FAD)